MTLDEFVEKIARIERLERLVFLLCEAGRDSLLKSDRLDAQDRQIIADFYDENRGKGW